MIQSLMETNEIYSLCLETVHVNIAVTKLSAVFGTGQLEKLVFASVDRFPPQCVQLHYISHEIERTLKNHPPVENYVVSEGKLVKVADGAVELSKSLAKLAESEQRKEG